MAAAPRTRLVGDVVDEGRLAGSRWASTISTRSVDGAAREVVQQAQGGLVCLVQVVNDQQQTGPRGREPHQLGGRDEQPLVAGLAVQSRSRPDSARSISPR